MDGLRRDLPAATRPDYDLIVVGSGIYGAMVTLEAARRGLRPLLLERDDFGGATSWNSHRIVHGGLRYLQRLDLGRFRTSVRERRWFLRYFPDLVEPLTCLMPLYGEGARRPGILRAALVLNHLLSRNRNEGVRSDRRLESGGVMTARETLALFPGARPDGLRGGALWYDAVMQDSQRLLMETLRWACANGARCLNYVAATSLRQDAGRITGVVAADRIGGDTLSFKATTVINCAGPWSGRLARALDGNAEATIANDGETGFGSSGENGIRGDDEHDISGGDAERDTGGGDAERDNGDRAEGLFRPSLAFNLLFECAPPSSVAVAVSAPEHGAHTWFLYPRRGYTYAGTAHFPCDANNVSPVPSPEQIDAAIAGMNAAVPGLDLKRDLIVRVHAGLLPALTTASADLADRPVIHDHGAAGGVAGLWSVSGVKYTTARDVAEAALRRAVPSLAPYGDDTERPAPTPLPDLAAAAANPSVATVEALRRFAEDEAVTSVDDLILRRGPWADDPHLEQRLRDAIAKILAN